MKLIKLIAALALGVTSLSSTASLYNDHYTLAVIQNPRINNDISDGNYANIVSQLAKAAKPSADERYENSMSLCAANIKLNDIITASKVCDKAVGMIDQSRGYSRTSKKSKYKALALNNRAIAKHLSNDHQGAYQDFNQALGLDNSPLIIANFSHFSSQMMGEQFAK